MNISAYQTKPLVHSFKKISTNKKLRMKKMKKKKDKCSVKNTAIY